MKENDSLQIQRRGKSLNKAGNSETSSFPTASGKLEQYCDSQGKKVIYFP